MSEEIDIRYEDLHKLLCDAFKQGVASYCDLANETCTDILNDFLNKQKYFSKDTTFCLGKKKANQTSTDVFANYQSFISSVITY